MRFSDTRFGQLAKGGARHPIQAGASSYARSSFTSSRITVCSSRRSALRAARG